MTPRAFGIWVFGLIASAIVGGAIGVAVQPRDGSFFGMIAGLSGFACLRMWFAERKEGSS